MNVTRFHAAPTYEAPNHFDMRCLRLQGHEAGPAEQLWLGVSVIAPGGGTTLAASPLEKHYVVLDGELTLVGERDGRVEQARLARWDSCRFAPGEARRLINHGTHSATVLLAMPLHAPVETSSP